jgi:hypothetical protein
LPPAAPNGTCWVRYILKNLPYMCGLYTSDWPHYDTAGPQEEWEGINEGKRLLIAIDSFPDPR